MGFFEQTERPERNSRLWFSNIHNLEELEEALSFARGLLEECVLAGRKTTIEVYTEKRTPNVQQPESNIPHYAGMTS